MAAGDDHADRLRLPEKVETRMVLAALLVAFWPVWLWYGERMFDTSDPSWGLLALLLLIGICLQQPRAESSLDDRLPLLGLVVYLFTFSFSPPLIQAAVAVLALVSVVSQRRFGQRLKLSVLGLGLLALPVLASFQFYFGYPMRLLVSKVSALLLSAGGLGVRADGTGLVWMDKTVMVDAPCSGINMLWVSMLFGCLIATIRNFSNLRTIGFIAVTVAATLIANILRATSLFYLEAGFVSAPPWAHALVGAICFALLLLTMGYLAGRIPTCPPVLNSDLVARTGSGRWIEGVLLLACVVASLLPLRERPGVPLQPDNFPGWPTQFEGRALSELSLSKQEEKFYKDGFPGKIARFSDGRREVLIRWVTRPTRALHPSQDCFRGYGYTVSQERLKPGKREFLARKNGRQFVVSEYITDDQGKTWTDVSAWYWDALLNGSQGPYWSYVVAQQGL